MYEYARDPKNGCYRGLSFFNKRSPCFVQLWRKTRIHAREMYVGIGSHIEYRRNSTLDANQPRMGRIKWLLSIGQAQIMVVQRMRRLNYKYGPKPGETEIERTLRQCVFTEHIIDRLRQHCGYFEMCNPSYFVGGRSYDVVKLAGPEDTDVNQLHGFYAICGVPLMQPDFNTCTKRSSSSRSTPYEKETTQWERASHLFRIEYDIR
jgi:hypothetical protein